MMDVMAWQQQAMIWTDGDLFHWCKYVLSNMCAVLNDSRRYHLPTLAILNYSICQNAIIVLSKLLKEFVKAVDGTEKGGNTPFFSHSHQPCKMTQTFK